MQSPPFPRYLVPPMFKYSPQHSVLKHPQLPFLPQCQRPSFNSVVKYTGSVWEELAVVLQGSDLAVFVLLRGTACLLCTVFALCNVIALSSHSTHFLGRGLLSLIPRMLQRPPRPINTLWLFPGDICSHRGSGTSSGYINKEGEGCTIPLTRRSSCSHNQPAIPL